MVLDEAEQHVVIGLAWAGCTEETIRTLAHQGWVSKISRYPDHLLGGLLDKVRTETAPRKTAQMLVIGFRKVESLRSAFE